MRITAQDVSWIKENIECGESSFFICMACMAGDTCGFMNKYAMECVLGRNCFSEVTGTLTD